MARSTNVLLACVAMLAAMLLSVVLTPHKLMARTHEVFDIEKHLPTAFGDWKPAEGLNVVAPAPPNRSNARSTTRRRRAASSTRRDIS